MGIVAFRKWFGVGAVALLGCGGRIRGQDGISFEFTVKSPPGYEFAFETIVAVQENVNSASSATLESVNLDVESPVGDTLGFIDEVEADAVVNGKLTELVTFDKSAPAGSTAALTVRYHGDLRPLFPDGHTLVVAWHGKVSSTYGAIPPEGIKVKCWIAIDS